MLCSGCRHVVNKVNVFTSFVNTEIDQLQLLLFVKKSIIGLKCAASEKKSQTEHIFFIIMMVMSFGQLCKCFVFALIFLSQ